MDLNFSSLVFACEIEADKISDETATVRTNICIPVKASKSPAGTTYPARTFKLSKAARETAKTNNAPPKGPNLKATQITNGNIK